MSVLCRVNYYSELCDGYMYGKRILELPEKIVDAIDEWFDGQTIDFSEDSNPDNVYVNWYCAVDYKEALVDKANILSVQEFEELSENDVLESFIEEHYDEISDRLNEDAVFLGVADKQFHFFNQ